MAKALSGVYQSVNMVNLKSQFWFQSLPFKNLKEKNLDYLYRGKCKKNNFQLPVEKIHQLWPLTAFVLMQRTLSFCCECLILRFSNWKISSSVFIRIPTNHWNAIYVLHNIFNFLAVYFRKQMSWKFIEVFVWFAEYFLQLESEI